MTKQELINENNNLHEQIKKLQEKSNEMRCWIFRHHSLIDEGVTEKFNDLLFAISRKHDKGHYPVFGSIDDRCYDNRHDLLINEKYAQALKNLWTEIRNAILRAEKRGITKGKDLLRQLNNGEITTDDFARRGAL